MSYNEMRDYIEYMLTDEELVALCNDIYDYKNKGTLKKDGALMKLSETLSYKNIRDIEENVLIVSANKLNKIVLLLLREAPYAFLKTVK